ncbi:Hpt domain-containing protein [Oerskovia flava]|uniref:Hpt domain-containing protein n=1 Tax=Oerskovia flava TaxID=2986422 RepID=UPI00223F38F4|nr:Hpt domain-containing protein [Oerskovia sp. JB1-3-2]
MGDAWRDLAAQLDGDVQAVRRFAVSYLGQLDDRLERLGRTLADGDVEAARSTALTLHCTSAMIGAGQLARFAGEVDAHLVERNLEAARTTLPLVMWAGDLARKECYVQLGAPAWRSQAGGAPA